MDMKKREVLVKQKGGRICKLTMIPARSYKIYVQNLKLKHFIFYDLSLYKEIFLNKIKFDKILDLIFYNFIF